MKIVCAGLSKTGTTSTANALRILGFKVHDFAEHLQYHMTEYDQAFSTGKPPDLSSMYSNVDAVTDAPACLFWKELKETFPEAKVILMERDCVDDWVKSSLNTEAVVRKLAMKPWNLLGLLLTPIGRQWYRIFTGIAAKGEYPTSRSNLHHLGKTYIQHNARVKASIPRDDLLVYNVKQGWKPLCDFLGVDVPDVPFPRLNAKSDMVGEVLQSNIFDKVQNEMLSRAVVLIMMSVMFAALVFFLMQL